MDDVYQFSVTIITNTFITYTVTSTTTTTSTITATDNNNNNDNNNNVQGTVYNLREAAYIFP